MELATEAAWCAGDQGKFFEYHHALYEKSEALSSQETLIELAVTIGLDRNTLAQCLSSGQHQADVEQAKQAAANRGINSTPTFFINNRRILSNEPYAEFQRIINQELAAAQ
ncbi:MAG: hypothetical protein EHM12_12235 [Dehalococcoidia bacterium]|nr:MAG: hypothetical protein EHM12_12235 [Dehalococcoidia bacterium]